VLDVLASLMALSTPQTALARTARMMNLVLPSWVVTVPLLRLRIVPVG
jgi:hypothetical protein